MARASKYLAPVLVLAMLLSSAVLVLPGQVAAANETWDVHVDFTSDPNHGNVDDVLSEALDGKFITQIYHCLSPCRIAECTESLLPPSRERFRADIKPTVLI